MNICLGYGGRSEIVRAMQMIGQEVLKGDLSIDDITEETIQEHLYVKKDVNLLIRTSQQRLSNFLLWQSAYAEFVFYADKHWPDFSEEIFESAINEYYSRDIKLGK